MLTNPTSYRTEPFHPQGTAQALVLLGFPPVLAKMFTTTLSMKVMLLFAATDGKAPEKRAEGADLAMKLANEMAWHARDIYERLGPHLDGDSRLRAKMDLEAAFAPREEAK